MGQQSNLHFVFKGAASDAKSKQSIFAHTTQQRERAHTIGVCVFGRACSAGTSVLQPLRERERSTLLHTTTTHNYKFIFRNITTNRPMHLHILMTQFHAPVYIMRLVQQRICGAEPRGRGIVVGYG